MGAAEFVEGKEEGGGGIGGWKDKEGRGMGGGKEEGEGRLGEGKKEEGGGMGRGE